MTSEAFSEDRSTILSATTNIDFSEYNIFGGNYEKRATWNFFQQQLTSNFCAKGPKLHIQTLTLKEIKVNVIFQVLCDILGSGGLPGGENGHQPPLYFAADDLEYQAAFPSERLGMGAFRIALESIFNRIHHNPLNFVSYGKPNPFVFKNAEVILRQVEASCYHDNESHPFKTLYMIGDNPLVDIKGAKQAGHPWFSILTRTGVYREKENHPEFPADLVVDTVEEAVDYILKQEYSS